jgi:cell division septum initiation protein DivIVA
MMGDGSHSAESSSALDERAGRGALGAEEGSGASPLTPGGSPLTSAGARIQDLLRTTEEAADGILQAAEKEAQQYVSEARRRLEAAEQEAERYKHDATERAEKLTQDCVERIATLSEELLAQADRASREAARLAQALGQATDVLVAELGLETEPSPVVSDPLSQAEREAAGEDPEPLSQRFKRFISPQSREDAPKRLLRPAELVALQMIVAGEDRSAIEQCMRDEFGVEDPTALVDDLPLPTARQPQ